MFACLVIVELQKRIGGQKSPSCKQIAAALWNEEDFSAPVEKITEVLGGKSGMAYRGNRYQVLATQIGSGVCFLVGTSLSETQYVSHMTQTLTRF